jgi:tetratricopeptide (TPR) repeat protein
VQNNLAYALSATGNVDDAIKMHLETLQIARAKLGPNHPTTLATTNNLARAYQTIGRAGDAISLWQSVLPLVRKTFGAGHSNTLTLMNRLAAAEESVGDWRGAIALRREAIAARTPTVPSDSLELAVDLAGLGRDLLKQHEPADAEPILRKCLAVFEAKQAGDWSTFYARSLLGASLRQQGQYAQAEPLLISGYDGLTTRKAQIPPALRTQVEEVGGWIVELYRAWGKSKAASQWSRKLGILPDLPADPFQR